MGHEEIADRMLQSRHRAERLAQRGKHHEVTALLANTARLRRRDRVIQRSIR
jgi:hypothetical protein